jgi:hypothetical protein
METSPLPLTSSARVSTDSAPRYLGQLCKHFAHRVPASWSEGYLTGRVEFPMGVCELAAENGVLTIRAAAENEGDLARLESVIARHLERFMFREPQPISWAKED